MPNSRDVHQLAKYVLGWQALLKLAKVERNNIFKDGEGGVDKESEGTRTANHHICYLLTPLRSSGKPYEYEILLHLLATSYGGRSSLVVMVCGVFLFRTTRINLERSTPNDEIYLAVENLVDLCVVP